MKLNSLLHTIDILNEWAGKIASLLIMAIIGVMVYEVVARYVFNAPTEWAFETSGFLFLAYILLGGGYTLLYRSHVNTDVIYIHFPIRIKAVVDLVGCVFLFLFCGVLLWEGGGEAWHSTVLLRHSNSPWSPPLYPALWMLPLGAGLLIVQGIADFIRALLAAVTGRKEKLHGH